MCFSAEADLVAGVVVGAIGVATLREVEQPKDVPLASLPLLFAAHQLTEVVVWWSLSGKASATSGEVAAWLYLVYAFCLLPVLVPVAVMAVEPDLRRKRYMAVCAAFGAAVAVIYLQAIVQGPVGARIDGNHIAYSVHINNDFAVDTVYVLVACTSWLLSTHRRLVAFGVVNIAAIAVLFWLTDTGRTSLWCVWAAVTSVLIYIHLRQSRRTGRPSECLPERRSPSLAQGWRQARSTRSSAQGR